MKCLAFFFVALFLFSGSVFGQEKSSLVVWTNPADCREFNKDLKSIETLTCDTYIVDGSPVRLLRYQGVTVVSKISDDGEHIIGDFYINNLSGERVLVLSKKPFITLYRSKQDFIDNKEKLLGAIAVTPEKIVDKMENRVIWANALSQFGANMQTQQSQINTDGKISTITTPNAQAQQTATIQNSIRTAEVKDKGNSILATALRQNTLFDKDSLSGMIYFKRHKKANFGIVFLSIGNVDFAFDIEMSKK